MNEVVACRHPEEESAASTPSRSLRLEKFQLLEEVREGEDDDEEEDQDDLVQELLPCNFLKLFLLFLEDAFVFVMRQKP